MIDIKTQYAGLTLRNPLIVGSSGLTNNAERNKEFEKAGAGAIVLKSLFEEQIEMQSDILMPVSYTHLDVYKRQVIVLAGGLREAASIINVEVARRLKDPSATRSSNQTAETFNFTLDEGLAVTSGDTLFTLEPFDEVFVRFSPGYQKQQVVKVGGETVSYTHLDVYKRQDLYLINGSPIFGEMTFTPDVISNITPELTDQMSKWIDITSLKQQL